MGCRLKVRGESDTKGLNKFILLLVSQNPAEVEKGNKFGIDSEGILIKPSRAKMQAGLP